MTVLYEEFGQKNGELITSAIYTIRQEDVDFMRESTTEDFFNSKTSLENCIEKGLEWGYLEIKKEDSSPYLELLNTYLPQMATEDEIVAWIKENVDFSSLKSPIQAMGNVMKHFGKLADGNDVKQILSKMGS